MREVPIEDAMRSDEGSFAAWIATILELPFGDVVVPEPGEDVVGRRVARWLGGLGVGRALVHRGGLRADILSDGMLRAGDAIRVVEAR